MYVPFTHLYPEELSFYSFSLYKTEMIFVIILYFNIINFVIFWVGYIHVSQNLKEYMKKTIVLLCNIYPPHLHSKSHHLLS